MKRSTYATALFAITLASAMLSFVLYSRHISPAQPVFFPSLRQHAVLVIDPGHGGEDGGAVSVSGVPESGINLSIANKCCEVAGLYGIKTIMLRTQDVSLATPDAQSIRAKKRSDLEQRAAIVNQTENARLLSIHQNKFDSPRSSGAQVFFRPGEPSQNWAVATQELLRQTLDPANDRMAKQIPDQIYLMSHIQCPAILVECGFLSNPEEDRLLQSDDYQRRIAVTLLASYLNHGQ
jgi:N-acetylmuramoyl-L-alanine amidase